MSLSTGVSSLSTAVGAKIKDVISKTTAITNATGASIIPSGTTAQRPASPLNGYMRYNTDLNSMEAYVDGAWGSVGGGSAVNGTSSRNTYTATAGQTTFNSTYDIGYVDVYRNGLKLAPSDFTATTGTTIILNNACSLNDVVDIVAYGTFELADAYTKNDSNSLLNAKANLASPTFTGTVTAPTFSGALSGNAGTATTLQTTRNIALTGAVTGNANFNGSANISIATTLVSAGIPSGGIILWSGAVASIPAGWYLCNGANGTPNLQDRFIVGAGSGYAVGATGGSANAIAVSHSHSFSGSGTTSTAGAHTHTSYGYQIISAGGSYGYQAGLNANYNKTATTSSAGEHSHTMSISGTTGSTGSDGTNANLPPYYALAYIMKS